MGLLALVSLCNYLISGLIILPFRFLYTSGALNAFSLSIGLLPLPNTTSAVALYFIISRISISSKNGSYLKADP